jgi:beta-lactamase regulating signal transducer with metallopeptidase domain
MRADTANRSFAALFGASLMAGMVVLCGAVGCVLVGLVVAEVARDGVGSLLDDGRWTAAVFVAVVGAGAVVGVRSFARQVEASRRLARRVAELGLPADARVTAATQRIGLRREVALVDCDESFSFAYGALTPRIVISRGLVEQATHDELAAVLEHERYHVRNLDPLKVLFARALPPTFFYLPALRLFEQRYVAGRELAADRRAVRRCGQRPLAGALFKVVRGPQWPELGVAAAIGGPELLDIRIAQLETGEEPELARLSLSHVAPTVAAGLLVTALFAVSVASFGGLGAVAGDVGPLDLAGAVMCAVPWAVGAWLGYRWLRRRAA